MIKFRTVLALFATIFATAADARVANNVYIMPASGVQIATWGPIALGSSAAVSGLLGSTYGGLGINASALTGAVSFAAGTASVGTLAHGNGGTDVTAAGTAGNVLYSNGTSWTSGALNYSNEVRNLSLAASVATNALTITVNTAAGTTASATNPILVSFRNSTIATGTTSSVSITGALSMTIPASTTIGTISTLAEYIYVYLINNAGTAEVAVSLGRPVDEGTILTTTAVSGGTSRVLIYSTTARSNVAARLIGRLLVTEATAGTWATAPAEISLSPFKVYKAPTQQILTSGTGATYTLPAGVCQIRVRLCGGGGGGSGGGTGGATGSSGGTTSFSTISCTGGSGTGQGGVPTSGAACTPGTGPVGWSYPGALGGGIVVAQAGNGAQGGNGGASPFQGNGGGGWSTGTPGSAAVANSCSGGGGGGAGASVNSGVGGSSGSYGDYTISAPYLTPTFTYTIGALGAFGAAGTTGGAGNNGGTGVIVVDETYCNN